MDEFSGYDHGARAGMFDKCNGKPRRDFTGVNMDGYAVGYLDGYNDAYNANEVKINI
jgi:hypothetical protein